MSTAADSPSVEPVLHGILRLLGTARALLPSAQPAILWQADEQLTQAVELYKLAVADPAAWSDDATSRVHALRIREELKYMAQQLRQASAFYSDWQQIRSSVLGGYVPGDQVVEWGRESRWVIEG